MLAVELPRPCAHQRIVDRYRIHRLLALWIKNQRAVRRRSTWCDLVRGALIALLVTAFFLTDAEEANGQVETPMSSRNNVPAPAKEALLTRSDAIMQSNNVFMILILGLVLIAPLLGRPLQQLVCRRNIAARRLRR